MPKTYRVLLHVASPTLPTLISLIDDHQDIRLVQVSDLADCEPLPPFLASPTPPLVVHARKIGSPPPLPVVEVAPTSRFVGGKRFKGISGKELVEEVLRSGPADMPELRRAFSNRNFAAASAAPYVSRMLRDGLIRRAAHGRFVLNPAPIKTTSNGS
jgi:hypothetical protein